MSLRDQLIEVGAAAVRESLPKVAMREVPTPDGSIGYYVGWTEHDIAEAVILAVGPLIRAQILTSEADWLDAAHTNSADRGYSSPYRKGFEAAAGWVRFHGDHPHLLIDRPLA